MAGRSRMRRNAALLLLTALAGACTGAGVDPLGMDIVEDVSPIRPMAIEQVCVQVNAEVKQEFTDGLFEALDALGLRTRPKATAFPGECPVWIRYEASWSGLPSYLELARVDVYQGTSRLGHALYDARRGGARPDRFGSAIGKLEPLLDGLFHHVQRETAAR